MTLVVHLGDSPLEEVGPMRPWLVLVACPPLLSSSETLGSRSLEKPDNFTER